MLARHMASYAPSLIVTAFFAFLSVSLFTSLMTQAEYGAYALTIATMQMLIGVVFYWLQSAASRLLPQAAAAGQEADFLTTLYRMFAVCGAVLLAVAVGLVAYGDFGDLRLACLFAPPLAVLRAFLNLNQAVHRHHIRIKRYTIIEIGQAVIGFVAAIALVAGWRQGTSGAAMGLLLGLAALSLYDGRMIVCVKKRGFDWGMAREIFRFGSPFIVTYGLSFILASSDRYLIDYFLGSDQVGVYAAAYAFPDRIGQSLFIAVTTASFPLVVRRLEEGGVAAARAQTYINGVAMLALVLPACVGLLLVNRLIATTLIGVVFRQGAIHIMPIITVAMIFNGLAAHYFDHAFLLAKKTRLFFFTLGPAALLNFVGNLYAIPHFGIIGAAYTTLAAYMLYLALSIVVGRRVFAIRFPFVPALKICLSTLAMAGVLMSFDVADTLWGLAIKIVVGGCVYAVALTCFDIMGIRKKLAQKLTGLLRKPDLSSAPFTYHKIVSEAEIAALADEWRDLYRRAGSPLFGRYEWFELWRRHLAVAQKHKPCLLLARSENGILQALLPLCFYRRWFLRMVAWAGGDVFDYADVIAASPEAAEALWKFSLTQKIGDIARIGSVHDKNFSLPVLAARMMVREICASYYVALRGRDGQTWLAAQSRKLRGDTRRKREKMQAQGAVVFHVHDHREILPISVIDALYAQKLSWFNKNQHKGVFAYPEMRNFLCDLAQDAARQGRLYLAWLSCGDTIAACHMGFAREGVLYLYLTTYDAAFAAFSPGNALMIETIQWAADHHYHEVDFMRGDEAYKQRFASGARELRAFVTGFSIIGSVVVASARRRAETL